MADEHLLVKASLRIISAASTKSLASSCSELYQANYAIALAILLLKESSIQADSHDTRLVEDKAKRIVGEITSVITSPTVEAVNPQTRTRHVGNGAQHRLQKYKTWLSKPDHAIVDFAHEWLKTRLTGLESVNERHDLRRIMMANGPALLAVLRRAIKKTRSARAKPLC
ncbi:hypothetical protein CC86DRAFT_389125 [Ophiobolus disseminans]|uniref:Uncharacterized protein n=1 Tax=Ophiobolus disseminans TaxID=1469910 RepID=A0A6A6ZBU5_9PLEO|nr:hypothetical protein CC86DRAFT_389125 [Ophiobolus disseminans]